MTPTYKGHYEEGLWLRPKCMAFMGEEMYFARYTVGGYEGDHIMMARTPEKLVQSLAKPNKDHWVQIRAVKRGRVVGPPNKSLRKFFNQRLSAAFHTFAKLEGMNVRFGHENGLLPPSLDGKTCSCLNEEEYSSWDCGHGCWGSGLLGIDWKAVYKAQNPEKLVRPVFQYHGDPNNTWIIEEGGGGGSSTFAKWEIPKHGSPKDPPIFFELLDDQMPQVCLDFNTKNAEDKAADEKRRKESYQQERGRDKQRHHEENVVKLNQLLEMIGKVERG